MTDGDLDTARGQIIRFSGERSGVSGTSSTPPSAGENAPRTVAGRPAVVSFDRRELQTILNVYGRRVASGEGRDYAIDFTPTRAVFSIFRRTSEVPLFRIEKDPKLRDKQGAYSVVASGGLILKRGHDLERVVEVLEKRSKFVVV